MLLGKLAKDRHLVRATPGHDAPKSPNIILPSTATPGQCAAEDELALHVRRQTAFAFSRASSYGTPTQGSHGEAPCPPVVSSLKGDKTDPAAVQMASYLACLRSSARFALARTSLRGSVPLGPAGGQGSPVDQLVVGDPHRVG